jgi:hypothetical protein
MAYWNNLKTRKKQILQGFGSGINTFNDPMFIKDTELTDNLNMCSDNYPALSVRPDRKLLSAPSSSSLFYGIGRRSSTDSTSLTQIHVKAGNEWKYCNETTDVWTVISSTLITTAQATFVEFNTQTAKYTILAHSPGSTQYNCYWDGTAFSTFASTASPRSNLMTAHKYRLYGVDYDGRTLRYSAQGDITDWTTEEDAGWIDLTDMVGKPTAILTFSNHVVIFSDQSMYELYGNYVDNFELVNISLKQGCVSKNAWAECEGKLYWMDYTGIYLYTGGIPRRIAHQAKKYIEGINWDYKHLINAGSLNGRLYFSIPYASTACNRMIVVDVRNIDIGDIKVNIEDGNFQGMVNIDELLIGWNADSTTQKLFNMCSTYRTGVDGTSDLINWSFETKPLHDDGYSVNTNITDIWVTHEGSTLATMLCGYWDNKNTTDNSTTFASMALSSDFTLTNPGILRTRLLPTSTQLQNANIYKFKFSGTRYRKFHGFQVNQIAYGEMV